MSIESDRLDIRQFIDNEVIESILEARKNIENPTFLKPYFDHFKEKVPYEKIRMALAIIDKENL